MVGTWRGLTRFLIQVLSGADRRRCASEKAVVKWSWTPNHGQVQASHFSTRIPSCVPCDPRFYNRRLAKDDSLADRGSVAGSIQEPRALRRRGLRAALFGLVLGILSTMAGIGGGLVRGAGEYPNAEGAQW